MAEHFTVHKEITGQGQFDPPAFKSMATSQKVDELLQRNREAIVKHHEQINQANDRIRTTQAFLEAIRHAQANVRRLPGWDPPPLDRQAL
ncbi:hypothetical protein ACFFSY_28605 [Paenibacillus aurantiacus]|uniref:Uncharacterized protein n=1 Tax=Paenibacillus aurantiacus TaxID=1936118 RepID=A0ABV5KZC5_9BACL